MYKYENFIGKVLDGRYKILELVGLGGMAFVLKAEDLVMNRIVAIKILNDEYNGNEQAEARFINESKAVAMLSNKNIVSIYDVAIYPDMKYIVMEFLDGITLREYLDNKGALPWKEACVYILQILRALEHAHSKGVIHRDIKPQNVILQKNGEIKVTDFGIAKLPNTPSLTLTEKAIGTVYYISPEQASGRETDYFSDIYSVGIMLYEAVTGSLPFMADSPLSIAMMQVGQSPQHPKELVDTLPEGVCQIILKAMEKETDSRFASAHSMSKAIEWVLRNPDVVFLLGAGTDGEAKNNPAAVSIDMIDTGEINDYAESEIADVVSNGKKKKSNKKNKDKQDNTSKPNRTLFPIITAVALSFIIVTVIMGSILVVNFIGGIINPANTGDEGAVFPNIVGEFWNSQFESNLANGSYGQKFKVDKVVLAENDNFKAGQIISQYPEPGQEKKEKDNSGFYRFEFITVCSNLTDVVIPNVSYYTATQARIILQSKDYQLKVDTVKESNYGYYDGQVIRTEPPIGSIATPGETVTLFICERTPSADTDFMPDLVGLTKKQAENLIKYTLYNYEFVMEQSINGTNRVVSQSISPGEKNPSSTLVTITVSIKLDGIEMPNLIGMTYSEAIQGILDIGIKVGDYSMFYVLYGDTTPRMETVGLNYYDAVYVLQWLGYKNAPDSIDAYVVYQSIPEGTIVNRNDEISLIYGVDIDE